MSSSRLPLVLSPALPGELLTYIINCHRYPTTILVCSPREQFVASLAQAFSRGTSEKPDEPETEREAPSHSLLAAPLYQVAVARHIRMIFIPTVSHLRSYLAAFDPHNSRIPPPPNLSAHSSSQAPLLLLYGLLNLHRESSEWSAHGISNTLSAVVETARRSSFRPVIVEPKKPDSPADFATQLAEPVPVVYGGMLRGNETSAERTVTMKRVLGRWFTFQKGDWDS